MLDEQDIFLSVLERRTPEERADYLDDACRGEPQLRRRVEVLVARHDAADDFLERPPAELLATDVLTGTNEVVRRGEPASTGDVTQAGDLSWLAPSSDPAALGMIGGYEVQTILGRGGMGLVLLGVDAKLGRRVALKVLAPELAANSRARQRFLREARATAAVTHPNVVEVFEVEDGEALAATVPSNSRPSLPYLVMEFIPGDTLAERLSRHGPLPTVELLEIGIQIADGLQAAHEQGLIHRDIKTANILLTGERGLVKITDFGLARAVDDLSLTRDGEVAGTPQFMSPEQARGEPLDVRSDLFSLGCVLYALATGASPFEGGSPLAMLRKVVELVPPSAAERSANVPGWVAAIIGRLLEKRPEDRYQSAAEVADLLRKLLAELRSGAVDETATSLQTATSLPAAAARGKGAGRPLHRGWMAGVLLGLLAGILILITTPDGTTKSQRVPDGSGISIIVDHSDLNAADPGSVPPSVDGNDDLRALIGQSDRWTWTDPVPLGNGINTAGDDSQPHLSPDGLALWFQSSRDASGQARVYVSRRSTVAEEFGPPVIGLELPESIPYAVSPAVTADELALVFATSADTGEGHMELMMATRERTGEPFGAPVNLGPTVNTRGWELSPSLSGDGLSLVFASSGRGAQGRYALFECRRDSRADPFAEAMSLGSDVNSRSSDAGPCLSADGLALVFRSMRDTGRGNSDFYLTTRAGRNEAFHPPVRLVAPFNSDFAEGKLTATADWSTVVFASNRPGGAGGTDLWITRRVPKVP